MSFDDADWAEVVSPSLTTIAQPTYEMGTAAVDLLSYVPSGRLRNRLN